MFTAQRATAEEVATPIMPKGGIKGIAIESLDIYQILKQISPELAKILYEKTGIRADSHILLRKFAILIKILIDDSKRKLRSKTKGLISIPVTSGYPENFS